MRSPLEVTVVIDPLESARAVGLHYVTDAMPGIRRQRAGNGFTYIEPDGHRVSERDLGPDQVLSDSTGLDHGLDLSHSEGPLAGDWARRQATQTASIPSAVPGGARPGEVYAHDRLRRGTAAGSATRAERPDLAGLPARVVRACGPFQSATQAKKNVVAAVKRVARKLGNRPATCRKYYVHPAIMQCYMAGELLDTLRPVKTLLESAKPSWDLNQRDGLTPVEKCVMNILQKSFEQNLRELRLAM